MPFAAVVFNPTKIDRDELASQIDPIAADQHWDETRWLETSAEDPGAGPARQAVAEGAEVVIAAGGDGTVRAVAEGLRDSGIPLALLPSGTGNLLARNLKVPLNSMAASIRAAFAGKNRRIDLGVATMVGPGGTQRQSVFAVAVGVGLDAQMIANSDEELKAKVGALAYVKSIVKGLRPGHRIHMRYRIDDDRTRHSHAHTVMIGNCGQLQGNVALLPDAEIDDGLLDLVALRPSGPIGWVQIGWKVVVENAVMRHSEAGRRVLGRQRNTHALAYRQCERIEIELRDAEEIELDGDDFGRVYAFRAEVDPGGLLVRVAE